MAQALGEDLADCYAIGDSANDLEMLQCVGHPLVMGNAPARVQAVAEYVTGTPVEDGLYHAMVHAGLLAE
ncbi:MAG: HAD family hydrolase [Oscillospiraceae bacterium]